MPRAEAQKTTERSAARDKRAPRKRAVRRTVPRKDREVEEVKSAKIADEVKVTKTEKIVKTAKEIKSDRLVKENRGAKEEVRRKAPLRIPSKEGSKRAVSKKPFVMLAVLVMAFLASAFIGFSDSGQINISSVVEERNQNITSGQTEGEDSSGEISAVVPVQNTAPPSVPNGGLRGRGVGTAKVASPTVEGVSSTTATSTSTSTDNGVGTSTAEVSEEVGSEIETESEVGEDEVVVDETETGVGETNEVSGADENTSEEEGS